MKRSVVFSLILIILLIACIFTGCTITGGTEISNPDAVIDGVKQISLAEYHTTYFLGQEFDYSKTKLKLLLETGEIKYLDVTPNSKTIVISGYNRFQAGEQTVSVKYGGKVSSTFKVTVIEPVIQAIKIKTYPTKNIYTEGDRLDMSGAQISVEMTNGVTIDFSVDNSIVSGSILNKDKEFVVTGEKLELNIRYGAKILPFTVTVQPKILTGIEIATLPEKREYYLNDKEKDFSPKGLQLRYTYNNGISQVVNADAQTNLVYLFDFSKPRTDSPVTVQYMSADMQVKFTAQFVVVVRPIGYVSIKIVQRPKGVDNLIENLSVIDYSTGIAEVTFDDGTTQRFAMNAPEINHRAYNNKLIGQQSIKITFNNYELNAATLVVTTEAKKAVKVDLIGVGDVQAGIYYEGQSTKISLGKLYYAVTYNNSERSANIEVEERMLKEGFNLICTANNGSGGEKTIEFLIEGYTVGFTVNIIAVKVASLEITAVPNNCYVVLGGSVNAAGGRVKVSYNNNKSETIGLDDSRISLVYDLSGKNVGDEIAVTVYCDKISAGDPSDSYIVTVIDRVVQSVIINQEPAKRDYKFGETLALKGLILFVTYADDGTSTITATADFIDTDGVAKVRFNDGSADFVMTKTALLSGGSSILTESGTVNIDFHGQKASFYVSVSARAINGISVLSTANVEVSKIVGNDYTSVSGLHMLIKYSDNSTESIILNNDAVKINMSGVHLIATPGWYWYTEGSVSEEGTLKVTIIYAQKTKQNKISTYPASYDVNYCEATLVRIDGLKKLENGVHVDVNTLGNQPKGLTPFFKNYYLAGFYNDNVIRFIPITFAMTDYDIKNLTEGKRQVFLSYAGFTVVTSIEVDNARVSSVALGAEPRKNYVFTEQLSLVGGTLVRSFEGDIVKQDTVDMMEAEFSFPVTKWPTSFDDFNGAAFLIITVALVYEGFTTNFTVTVYPPQELKAEIRNTLNYYGQVSEPVVIFEQKIKEFLLPTYTLRFKNFDGSPILDEGHPVIDKNGNVLYVSPKIVNTYIIMVTSDGNNYYNSTLIEAEFRVSPLSLTLTPNYIAKIYGEKDPVLSYSVSSQYLWDETISLLVSGKLTRTQGENVGSYAVSMDPNEPFIHPYFLVTVVAGGTLTVNPKLVEAELKSSVLFYQKGEEGTAIDQKANIGYYLNFVSYDAKGNKMIVKQSDFEGKPSYPEYELFNRYLTELTNADNYLWKLEARKGTIGDFSESLAIAEIGLYNLRLTLQKVGSYQNFMFDDEASPGIGVNACELSLSVQAEPWVSPSVGTRTLALSTDLTDTNGLEELVRQREILDNTDYDIVITNNYVYVWKYRKSQWNIYPEGEFFAYNTERTGTQWVKGYNVWKDDLNFVDGQAFIKFKILGNEDDKADSLEVSSYISLTTV